MIWNVIGVLIARLCSPFVRMLLFVVVSRRSGPTGLGELQVILTYFAMFETVAGLGLSHLVTREVARDKSLALVYAQHGAILGLAAGAAAALIMNVLALGYSQPIRLGIAVLSVGLIPSGILSFSEATLVALGRANAVPLLLLTENVLIVLSGVVIFRRGGTVVELAGAMVLMRILVTVGAVGVVSRMVGGRLVKCDLALCRHLLSQVPVFLGSTLAWIVLSGLDVVVLSRLRPLAEVGLYTAAARLVTAAQSVPQSILFTTFPILAEASREGGPHFASLVGRTSRYLAIATLPLVVGLATLAPQIVRLLFGAEFVGSESLLRALSWSLVPFVIMKLGATTLLATNRQVSELVINWATLAISCVLHVWLVSAHGAAGSVYAVLVSTIVACAMRIWALRADGMSFGDARRWAAMVAAAISLGLWLMVLQSLPVIALVISSVPLYVGLLVLFRTFSRSELRTLPGADRWLARRWLAAFFPPDRRTSWIAPGAPHGTPRGD